MKKAVFFGAGQVGAMVSRLIGAEYLPLCFIDNFPPKWGGTQAGLPVLSPKEGLAMNPDVVFLCVLDNERAGEMRATLLSHCFTGEIIRPDTLRTFDVRYGEMRLICSQLNELGVVGDTAELGVYKGDFAAAINAAMPDRTLHLFDTFEGFSELDVTVEQSKKLSGAKAGDFADTSAEFVRSRLPHPEKAVFYKGYFPHTFEKCMADKFSFVSLDADLYAPTAAALPIFFERLSNGGAIMVHDVISTQFTGVKKAVDEFCKRERLIYTPVCDLHGSVILRK